MIEPGTAETVAHRLDPRSKFAFQAAFALAAFAHTTPRGLALLTAVAGVAFVAAGTPTRALWAYRPLVPFLVAGPVVEAVTLAPPWIAPAEAVPPALASYRVALIALVSVAYLRSTPVRESRAAIQRLLPGRVGVVLGLGTAFVLRFLPVLRADLASIRAAMRARLGDERPFRERVRLIGTAGLRRAFARSDRFALALRGRCFAWNPTLPRLAFGPADAPVLAFAAVLALSALA